MYCSIPFHPHECGLVPEPATGWRTHHSGSDGTGIYRRERKRGGEGRKEGGGGEVGRGEGGEMGGREGEERGGGEGGREGGGGEETGYRIRGQCNCHFGVKFGPGG